MAKIIFRKPTTSLQKRHSTKSFDVLLEQHRKKAKKRLRISTILLLIEALAVILLTCFALYKLQ